MIGLIALLGVGSVFVVLGLLALFHAPSREPGNLQVVEIRLCDFMELRALSFKNFPRLFSDSDFRALRAEPRLASTAKRLRTDRKRLALRWLASVRSDVLSLWLLRRLLTAYGVSEGLAPELAMTCRVILVLASISTLRSFVFVFGPFAFRRLASRSRKYIETYSRSCQAALGRLPKSEWENFGAAWRYHRAES